MTVAYTVATPVSPRLALQTGCPIFPVGLQGTLEVQPPDSSMPRPFRMMRVRIGRPIEPGSLRGSVR